MFDIGFWELTVLGVIALIVLGPERLPVVARTLGQWVGRAKGYMREVTSELEREVRVDEIRDEVRRAREQIESETRETVEPVMKPLDPDDERADASSKPPRDPVAAAGAKAAASASQPTSDADAAAAKTGGARSRASTAATENRADHAPDDSRE